MAFIGNALPRRCGIATFTTDLQEAVARSGQNVDTAIVAMTDHGGAYDYPPTVRLAVNDARLEEYAHAAEFLNAGGFDTVCLQHEFGIFGGEAGGFIMALLARLEAPIVTTLHTVLAAPKPMQRDVLDRIIAASSSLIVMAEKGRELLRSVYDVPPGKIEVIPHGIPDSLFAEPDAAKARLGFAGRTVILTFGLLSPNKGIEVMIDAMPAILGRRPDAVYVVLGATHPNLVRNEGEDYRDSLIARARARGIENQVVFLNQFVDQAILLEFIAACDVYVTPYLNETQMTSGTLAYSFGMGKAVVSTPYWHARELLAEGRGVLVPFGDAATTGEEIAGLLTDDGRRNAMRRRAYAGSRSMTWERTALRYLRVFERAARRNTLATIGAPLPTETVPGFTAAPMRLGHFLSMCDDTGLFQHAVLSVPDRAHGYCIDDNARALLVACALNNPGETALPEALTARLAAFVQHAWNPHNGRFKNFMSFERRWLEEQGSEDSHGRALWALGECARSDNTPTRRRWAADLFVAALPAAERFNSPRAWAFALLGLDAYCGAVPGDSGALRLRLALADRLLAILAAVQTPDWVWFESGLSYDNARLSQALLVTGRSTGSQAYLAAGLETLDWLMRLQISAAGVFQPVGSDSFGDQRAAPRPFDQQPLEATAAISACLAAWRADGAVRWRVDAARAFDWFFGVNDLMAPLVDPETGACRDGLHADRANENRGGESAVSYLLSLAEMRLLARTQADHANDAPVPALPGSQRVHSAASKTYTQKHLS